MQWNRLPDLLAELLPLQHHMFSQLPYYHFANTGDNTCTVCYIGCMVCSDATASSCYIAGLTVIILNTISLQLPVPRGPVPSTARPATTPEMTQSILCVINAQYSAATALSSITQQLAQFATKVRVTISSAPRPPPVLLANLMISLLGAL